MLEMNRRTFASGALAAIAGPALASSQEQPIRKALIYGMLPERATPTERLRVARSVGFEGVEVGPVYDPAEARRMREAADAAGVVLHSVIYGGWHAPLSSEDPAVIAKAQQEIRDALRCAAIMGCDGLLLVPAVVNAKTPYADAMRRSRANIRPLVSAAARAKVRILIEPVWNNFLLSPLEFAAYVDSFRSEWVQAYFDVGNVVRFGWPQDWIRTLGGRIRKVHLKDFKGGPGLGTGGQWVPLLEGSIDWPEVRRALRDIGYAGWVTTEVGGGDEAYLTDLRQRVERILAM